MSSKVKLPHDIYCHLLNGLQALQEKEHADIQFGVVSAAGTVLSIQKTKEWFVRNFEGDRNVTGLDTLRELHGEPKLQETGQWSEGLQEPED